LAGIAVYLRMKNKIWKTVLQKDPFSKYQN
jgi:hypothetical protein